MRHPFANGVAVITGGASGIGLGLARYAVANEMKVIIADVDQQNLNLVQKQLGRNAFSVKTDVSKFEDVDTLAKLAFEKFGQVDLLFNNAGILRAGNIWTSDLGFVDKGYPEFD